MDEVNNVGGSQEPNEEDTRPVEVHRRDVVAIWPKAPEEIPACVNKRDDVDGHPKSAKAPACMRKLLSPDPFHGNTSNRDHVGRHERCCRER